MNTYTPKNQTLVISKLHCFILVMAFLLGAATAFAQPNNNCASATPLTVGAPCTNGTNVGATVEAGETAGATGTGCWGTAPNNTVWYTFTTGLAGNYTVSTDNGGSTDTQLKILSGSCGAFTSVACNEDAGVGYAFAAVVSATLPASTTYYVQLDVFGGSTGPFCINVTYNPPISNDCIFNAIDITAQINGINPTTNPFDCAPYTYAAGGSAPTSDMVNGNNTACDPGPDYRDIWFSFTVTATTPDVWIDVYQLVGTTPDYTAAVYSGTPGGTCGSTITGLTTIDCSDGVSPGGALDVGACTTPLHPRINVSTLPPGTYYYRVWEWGGGTPTNATINLCIESATPVGITSDACPGAPTMGFGCGTAANVNINETYTNLSNAGCLGNACNTAVNEPQLAVGGAGQIHPNCAGPWLTSVGYINNVMNNSAIYAFNVNASGTCQASVTINFSNITYAGTNGNVMQVQVMSGTCAGGTSAVMAGTTNAPCFEMRPASGTLPNGTYYIVVDGQDGQLLQYDLNLLINYAGAGCTPTTPPPAPTATNGSRCGTGTVTLSAGGCAGGTITWYAAATGGTSLATGTSFTTPSISTTTTYYASCSISGCEGVRVAVTATVTAPQVATFSYTGTPYCQTAANPSPTFSGGGVAGTFSSTAGLVFISTSTGEVNLSASTPGTYTVTNTIPASGGCPVVTATASITITAPQVATFSYTGSPYCQSATNPSPTFSGGGVAGTFSSTAGLVFVSTSTGEVNLSASTPGTYTVTNSITASGGCPAATATASITITAPQVATFSYTGTPYCQNAANPSPTFSGGGVAGTFSSTAGLVFVSSATGEVNIAASTAGTYTVTNTIAASGGCPTVTATASITITAPQVATFNYTGTPYCQSAANPSPTFSGGGVAGTFSSTTGLVFVSNTTGEVNLASSTAGTYTVTNTIAASGGCPAATATASITITAPQVATFSYTGTPYCQNATNPSPTFSGGGVAGTFSSTAGLVFVSNTTGEVNLASSTPGTYTVTNTIAASGGCPVVTATASITITAPQVATFSYTGTPYCQNAANPSPTFSGGGVAGTFSSTAGLVFVSTATGEVNLSASTAGTYTVTNTIAASGGCPAVTETTSITISALQVATFSYTASPYCQNAVNPSPTFSGGGVAGTFSSTAGLVFVSNTTGEVNLASSTPGTYTVTNTIAASGGCPAVTATASITITAPQVATFSYTGTPYCQNATNPSPTFSGGGVAGTFSSTAGLVFVSTATGEVNLSASTAGTYTVTNTIAASGGCPAVTATSSITIDPVQSAAFNYASSTFCATGTNPTPTITGTPGGTFTSSPAGLVFVSSATGEIDLAGSTLNTYSVTYTTAGPCSNISTATVTITNAPDATFSYTGTPYCQNAANPSPTFSGGGTAGVFSSTAGLIFVSTTSGQIDLAASTAGTYTVTNTIAASGGCSAATATASITINPVQNSGFNYSSPTFCQTGTNPTPTITGVAGGTFSSSPAGLIFTSTSTGEINLSGSSLNTYTITYTTAGPCQSSSTATVTISNPTSAVMNYNGPYCQTAANPTPVFGAGASAGTFSSTAGLVFVNTSTGEVNLSASTAGTYVITNTIAASGGCPASTDTAGITITAPQTATFSYTGTPYCQGAANPTPTYSGGGVAGTFTASSGSLVFVSTATGEIDLAACTPGTYTITNTVAATGGCPAVTATANITITAPQVATFSYTGTPYCQNAANPSPTFSGGGVAGTFSSTAGLVFISTATGEVDLLTSTSGTYTVTNTIAASGGCPAITATATITINPVQSATFNYASSTFCASGTNPTPTITGTAGGTFTSSPAGLTFVSSSTGEINLAGSSLNTYTVTYTTAGPCSNSSTATVTITNAPVATFSYTGTPYCQNATNPSPTFSGGGTAGVFSSTAGLVFVNTATGEVDLLASTPGTYTVTNTIAASGGCAPASATASITIDPLQNAGFNYSASTFCSSGTNPIPTITGVIGGTFTSSPSGLTFVSSSTGEINLAGSSLNTYTITYTTAGPCSNSSTATVTITNSAVATFSFTGSPYCQSAANPSPTFSGGGTAGTFSSTAGLVFVSSSTGQINLAASTPGTYTITNTIPASGGCPAVTATSSVTITAPQTAAFSYTGTPYCQSAANPSPTFSGGGVAGTFSSTAGLVLVSATTGEVNLSASTPGTYTVTNTIAASGGCPAVIATASITITTLQNAGFNYSSPAFCQTGPNPTATITGVAGGTFTSSPAGLVFVNTTTGEINLSGSSLNTYTVTYTTPGPCTNTSTTTIAITPSPTASASSVNVCAGQTLNLTSSGGGTYSWVGPDSFTSTTQNPSVTNASTVNSGTYTVTVNTGGCTDTAQVAVTVYSLPTVSAGTDMTISSGTSVTLNASGGSSYTWNPSPDLSCTSCANPTVSPTQTTTYCVVVSNGNCADSACVTITVEIPCPTNKELEVPNAFSPNNDGSNDLFCIPGWDGCIDRFHILIFDRWGEKVFESTDPSFCWDGSFRGQTMNPGVFVYYINATIFNGDNKIKKGNISLIQ